QLNFAGNFNGFFIDFVADGVLESNLGRAEMDMRMDLRQGRELAEYSGGLRLTNFDLGEWSGNTNFDKISFNSKVEDGEGLTIETVNAQLKGKIDHFTFKGYTYENIDLNGALTRNLFDGTLNIHDENIDLAFDGSIDFVDSIPKFDFSAKINQLDLKNLNLIKEDLVLAGEVDLNLIDKNISNIQGDAFIRNFRMLHNQTDRYILDSLVISSHLASDARRSLDIQSEVLEGAAEGYFDLGQIKDAALNFVERNYARLSERFNIRSSGKAIKNHAFDFELAIKDSKNFTQLLDRRLDTLKDVAIEGYLDNIQDSIYLDIELPFFRFDNIEIVDVLFDIKGKESESLLEFEIYHTNFNGQKFEPITLAGELEHDTLFFDIVSTNFTSIFDDLHLNGQIFPIQDRNYQVSFFPSNLVILEQEWSIDADNFLRFGKGFIETNNFDLRNQRKRIVLESLAERGLKLGLENITLSLIDDWWDYDNMDFSGLIDIEVTAEDVFKLEGLNLTAQADTFEVNGDDWGVLRIDASLADLSRPTDVYMSITNTEGNRQLTAEGIIAPFKKGDRIFKDDLDLNITLSNYPLDIAEYFIGNIISNTIGHVDANIKLNGKLKKPNIGGTIRIYDSALTVDYLQTRYRIEESFATVSNT
ncbi:MAG: hypothetical protein AAGD05_15330, partial [Bacteroidota bacterium]